MKVLKFGGTSVGSAAAIESVIDIVRRSAAGSRVAVVLSAMHGTTDLLIDAGRRAEGGDDGYLERISEIGEKHQSAIQELFGGEDAYEMREFVETTLRELEDICEGVRLVGELSPKTLDRILSFGEVVSSRIFSATLDFRGIDNVWHDSRTLIRTDSNHGAAAVDLTETDQRLSQLFAADMPAITVFPGFIASDADGYTTTLGRGGSDYTAAIIAAAAGAEVLEIWTDVNGMMSADPRFVRNVRRISHISYREAMELSHFGAKVIYPPTIQPVMVRGIPIHIRNTFEPDEDGTLIGSEPAAAETEMVRGITSIDRIAVLNLEGSGMVGVPGFSRRLFDALSRAGINVILITQSSSEHSICVAIEDRFAAAARSAVDREFENEIAVGKIDPLRVEEGFSILALVGDNMRSHTGVSGRMFTTLGHNGINIHAIAQGSSERNISAIIASTDVRKAINTLHEAFFSDGSKQVNVFIAGTGTVGSRLIAQLDAQQEKLLADLRLNLRVTGVANSRRAVVGDEAIDLGNLSGEMATAPEMSSEAFTDAIIDLNLRNSIFVDVTASDEVVRHYQKLLARSVSVIACNKIAASSDQDDYDRLKATAREYDANFFFETNVGAGLPVIHTLNDLIRSGDRVRRIEAVLSGTLNFVFNNYDGSRPFADVVRQARDEGYTEPDPRLDLSGTDVARKILILARECGRRLDLEDVEISGFLPESCLAGTVEDFFAELAKNETHFAELLAAAVAGGRKLKYIATFDGDRAAAGLEAIRPDHNFSGLSGKDNAVQFYTDRYSKQPLVIKGAGAGADVTAAGVFADIIRAAR